MFDVIQTTSHRSKSYWLCWKLLNIKYSLYRKDISFMRLHRIITYNNWQLLFSQSVVTIRYGYSMSLMIEL